MNYNPDGIRESFKETSKEAFITDKHLIDNKDGDRSLRGGESEADIRKAMLKGIAVNSNKIYDLIEAEEESKKTWRKKFMNTFVRLLIFSVVFVVIMTILDSLCLINLKTEIIIGFFVYIIANIFTAIYLSIKYINTSQYLNLFKTVSSNLLDYLACYDKE